MSELQVRTYQVSFTVSGPELSGPDSILRLTIEAIKAKFPIWIEVDNYNVQLSQIDGEDIELGDIFLD